MRHMQKLSVKGHKYPALCVMEELIVHTLVTMIARHGVFWARNAMGGGYRGGSSKKRGSGKLPGS